MFANIATCCCGLVLATTDESKAECRDSEWIANVESWEELDFACGVIGYGTAWNALGATLRNQLCAEWCAVENRAEREGSDTK